MRFSRILYINPRKVYQEIYNHSINIPKINLKNTKYLNNYYNEEISPKNINNVVCKYKDYNNKILENINYNMVKEYWNTYNLDMKIEIFLKFRELVNTKYKNKIVAYTMINHNKSIEEAEKDSIIDFTYNLDKILLKFNDITKKNKENDYEIKYNPLDGFVSCSTSFNSNSNTLLSIIIPLLFGNSVIWNPHCNSILINHLFYEILLESGIPQGLLNFIPLNKGTFINNSINNKNLGCLFLENNFYTNKYLYNLISKNKIKNYYNYEPKLINLNYGNNFHFIDESICKNPKEFNKVVSETFNSAYNYSGQEPNACARVYLPHKYFNEFIDLMNTEYEKYDFTDYGVVNKKIFLRNSLIESNFKNNIILGSELKLNKNYFVKPMLILNDYNKYENYKIKKYQGPVLTVCLYDNNKTENALINCNKNSYNCKTGSIYSSNSSIISLSKKIFTNIEDILLINKPCNVNYFNSNIISKLYKFKLID